MAPREIKALRAKLGLTQDALARRLGVTPTTVARWEQGVHPPKKGVYLEALLRLREETGG